MSKTTLSKEDWSKIVTQCQARFEAGENWDEHSTFLLMFGKTSLFAAYRRDSDGHLLRNGTFKAGDIDAILMEVVGTSDVMFLPETSAAANIQTQGKYSYNTELGPGEFILKTHSKRKDYPDVVSRNRSEPLICDAIKNYKRELDEAIAAINPRLRK